MIAERVQTNFEPFVNICINSILDSLFADIPHLLKQSLVKIKVIADSADQCIIILVKETQFKNIKYIVEGARNQKDVLLRRRCMNCIWL